MYFQSRSWLRCLGRQAHISHIAFDRRCHRNVTSLACRGSFSPEWIRVRPLRADAKEAEICGKADHCGQKEHESGYGRLLPQDNAALAARILNQVCDAA